MVVGKISVTLNQNHQLQCQLRRLIPQTEMAVSTLGAKHLQLPDGKTLFFSGQPTT
jgi:hypothetical protein